VSEVVLLAGAEIHFHEVYAQLAVHGFARAERFDNVVQEAFQQLAAYPRSAPEFIGKYRRLLLGEFPFALYYIIEGERIFIHALLDIRQSPESILRRLGR
jgi:plasmid stabilization system protein ParE